ncbi:MAG: right-handed parallel beta-helix repeat-containing protein [Pseudobutyrivibrio sp.]|nr:right-handed parallel beta-helix repeat-containing protein [Pseudobutyrivibrio sp.]
MKKQMGMLCSMLATAGMLLTGIGAEGGIAMAAENFDIPAASASGRVGASVPYTRYDSEAAAIGGGASVANSVDWGQRNIASQASGQSYVRLPQAGSYAKWTMNTSGAGVTMRFTMPDAADGKGLNGSVDVYVNGSKKKTVDLTSYYMWQYFSSGNPSDTDDGGASCFAFDEVHFLLDTPLKAGDEITIMSTGASGLEYGVDFIEVEDVPAPIEQPANSVNVCDFGANPDDAGDDYDAIYAAIEYANNNGMDVYIPEGTFNINQTWRLYGSDMKITGAGMWYTNIQFTNPQAGGGGISGGWDSNTGSSKDGNCSNIEFCNMYINSNLCSRYNQQAVYKCFMDVFKNNSVIHDVWEEHFECGFWLGDYNGIMDYSDGLKIVNCRIRNNLADGVNFCQGTSNAVVYNCNIRNNGDDGLAMWNNTYGNAKDETGNIFAYNTIEFIWRAGGIAIYGGDGHHIYNNYIIDTFMAAGIHLNTTFDGYKFSNNRGITFDNNILVRCGTSSDSWQEELGAVDVKQDVKNVTFNNTEIYDSQHEGVRILDGSPSGIVFNNTKIFGAGVDGQTAHYSSISHEGAAIRCGGEGAVFNGLEIGNIAYKGQDAPYFFTGGVHPTFNNVTIYDDNVVYQIPGYPTPDGSQGGGVVDPLDGISGYDLKLTGLTWEKENGNTALSNGDKVVFKAAVKNDSNVDIPEGVAITLKVTVDDAGNYVNTSYKDGLRAGESVVITTTNKWMATKGGHRFEAKVDYKDRFDKELSETNNSRVKKVNVKASNSYSYVESHGGYDLQVLDVNYNSQTLNPGDNVVFNATIVNAGDMSIPAGTVIGVQFKLDGDNSLVTWCDSFQSGLGAGQSVTLAANGGINGNSWTATEGSHTVTAWVDDVNRLTAETNEGNNTKTKTFGIPLAPASYYADAEGADVLSDLNNIYAKAADWTMAELEAAEGGSVTPVNPDPEPQPEPEPDPEPEPQPEEPTDYTRVTGGYDLFITKITTNIDDIKAGDDVIFTAEVVNAGDRDIPAGTIIGAQYQVDGDTSVYTWSDSYSAGLRAGERVLITANGGTNGNAWKATAGSHTVTAWVDDVNRLSAEVNENNNRTSKTINVSQSENTNSQYDLVVTSVSTNKDSIYAGQELVFSAEVKNVGNQDIPSGTIIGVQYSVDGSTSVINWCDNYSNGLAAGQSIRLTANGGTYGNAWHATSGTHTVTAWVDDVNRLPAEADENNNKTALTFNVQ